MWCECVGGEREGWCVWGPLFESSADCLCLCCMLCAHIMIYTHHLLDLDLDVGVDVAEPSLSFVFPGLRVLGRDGVLEVESCQLPAPFLLRLVGELEAQVEEELGLCVCVCVCVNVSMCLVPL